MLLGMSENDLVDILTVINNDVDEAVLRKKSELGLQESCSRSCPWRVTHF